MHEFSGLRHSYGKLFALLEATDMDLDKISFDCDPGVLTYDWRIKFVKFPPDLALGCHDVNFLICKWPRVPYMRQCPLSICTQ